MVPEYRQFRVRQRNVTVHTRTVPYLIVVRPGNCCVFLRVTVSSSSDVVRGMYVLSSLQVYGQTRFWLFHFYDSSKCSSCSSASCSASLVNILYLTSWAVLSSTLLCYAPKHLLSVLFSVSRWKNHHLSMGNELIAVKRHDSQRDRLSSPPTTPHCF